MKLKEISFFLSFTAAEVQEAGLQRRLALASPEGKSDENAHHSSISINYQEDINCQLYFSLFLFFFLTVFNSTKILLTFGGC